MNQKITKYDAVEDNYHYGCFIKKVQEMINSGWEPYGPPTVSYMFRHEGNALFNAIQVMVKREEEQFEYVED